MDQPINKERLRSIKKILSEVAAGNFNLRYKPSALKDDLEALGIAANMLTENLETAFLHENYFHPLPTKRHLVHLCFIINNDYRVVESTAETFALLQCKPDDVLGTYLYDLARCTKESMQAQFSAALKGKNDFSKLLALDLGVTDTVSRPVRFKVNTLYTQERYLLSSYETVLVAKRYEQSLKKRVHTFAASKKNNTRKFHHQDKALARKVAGYISTRINQKLDSIDTLVQEFNTNSTHLRVVFKNCYGMSIRDYHKEKRLTMGRDLLMKTTVSVKNIADYLGFSDSSHFIHTFKKRYDYTPRDLRQYALHSENEKE